jgi:hypothetical protein
MFLCPVSSARERLLLPRPGSVNGGAFFAAFTDWKSSIHRKTLPQEQDTTRATLTYSQRPLDFPRASKRSLYLHSRRRRLATT